MSWLSEVIMFGILVWLSACVAIPSPTSVPGQRQLSESDNGTTLDLRAGDRFQVKLRGNPSTGYQWEPLRWDQAVTKAIGEPAYARDNVAVGSGGEYLFTFEAGVPGQTTVQLVYHRPWEKDIPPLQTFEVKVVVEVSK